MKNNPKCFLLALAILLNACNNTLKKSLDEFYLSTVIFPKEIKATYFGKDSLIDIPLQNKFTGIGV
jgi:hypothetical protein